MRTPRAYRVADGVTEGLVYFGVVFAPWAFGTTELWSVWTLRATGYALALALALKWALRWRTGYRPVRWGIEPGARPRNPWAIPVLAGLTVFLLGYTALSAFNARATFLLWEARFEYRDTFIRWLPHSYDAPSTWAAFLNYLALAGWFWALRDWLLGRTARERRREEGPDEGGEARGSGSGGGPDPSARGQVPARLRRLCWVLCLNAALLAVFGILQRLDGTGKLLWLRQPIWNTTAEAQFGPYAYRSNGAQYLNLLWPLCLGFWWMLREEAKSSPRTTARAGGSPHVLLLPCAIVAAAGPIVSTSRGGAITAALGLVVASVVLTVANRGRWLLHLGTLGIILASVGLGAYLGWAALEPRLRTLFDEDMSGRKEIYENAIQMAHDYPWFGTGPGTFASLYQLYRSAQSQHWHAYLHDDWLETRVTFGWLGFLPAVTALLLAVGRWPLRPGGIAVPWVLPAMLWLSVAGLLFHARGDFPLQVLSLTALLLTLLAVLSCLSRR